MKKKRHYKCVICILVILIFNLNGCSEKDSTVGTLSNERTLDSKTETKIESSTASNNTNQESENKTEDNPASENKTNETQISEGETNKNETNNSETKINKTVADAVENKKMYHNYKDKIYEFMNSFQGQYSNYLAKQEDSLSMITGGMDIPSAEGNQALKYIDSKDHIIRYKIDLYGESGKRNINYYVLEDNILYVTDLITTYSSPFLSLEGDDDLQYDLKKYIIDHDNVFYIEDIEEKVVEVPKSDTLLFNSLKELNKNFIADTIKPIEYSNDSRNLQEETIIFQFKIKDSSNTMTISMGKEPQDYLIYRFGTMENNELVYPEEGQLSELKDSWKLFAYSSYFRGGGTLNEGMDANYLSFENNNYQYTIYEEYIASDDKTYVGIRIFNMDTGKETELQGDYYTVVGSLSSFKENDKVRKVQ